MPSRVGAPAGQGRLARPRATALLALSLLASVHLITLTISPSPWQDEVQIIDHGRNLIAPDPAWAINWLPLQRPIEFLNFLGPMAQEAAYRALAPSIAGPRLSSLLGAIIASYLVFLWLRSRQLADVPALIAAATFLLDPVFVAGYRGARIDSWTIALAVGACLAVRHTRPAAAGNRVSPVLLLPGALMVAAFFIWPSAIYLGPLFVAEVCAVYVPLRAPLRRIAVWALVALAGTLAALGLFLFAAGDLLGAMLADRSFSTGAYYQQNANWAYLVGALRNLAQSYQQSPILPALAVFFAVTGRNPYVAAAAGVALLAALPTMMYVHRVVYFLPYIISIVGEGWRWAEESRPRRSWPTAVMALALLWAIGLSLVVRPTLALMASDARQPSVFLDAAAQMPELRSQRLYLGPWEFYYAGRQLDWKMVRPYGEFADEPYRQLFNGLDYALVREEESRAFLNMGWHATREFTLPPVYSSIFGRGASPPRRYFLYVRQPQAGTPLP